ncbi:peptide deformylase [Elongatibacter sediminis]|uniref:Peptide deformylase n=1 Tax=Elongatibacter sediminis TaxID=3119006 RepID=A0AAW9RAZ3_9GAMM
MATREILRMGHPVLRRVARPLEAAELEQDWLRELVDDMVDTLHQSGGIGLAAPQVGVSVRLAIIEISGGPTRYGEIPPMPLTVFVNPELTVLNDRLAGYWEGCLSVPGLRGYVERPQQVRVAARNLQGETFEHTLDGFLATVFQHEFDHLDGRLYVDRLKDSRLLVFEDLLADGGPGLEE